MLLCQKIKIEVSQEDAATLEFEPHTLHECGVLQDSGHEVGITRVPHASEVQ